MPTRPLLWSILVHDPRGPDILDRRAGSIANAAILGSLRNTVAAEGLARGLAGPLILLICARLRFLLRRFETLACASPRAPKPDPRRNRARARTRPPLPARFAFLLRAIPASAAARSQLRDLLDAPGTVALIDARPATGRALRPLCHLLGLKPPPHLALPPRPRKPRPPAPPRPPRPSVRDLLRALEPRPDASPLWPRAGNPMRFFPRRIVRRPRAKITA